MLVNIGESFLSRVAKLKRRMLINQLAITVVCVGFLIHPDADPDPGF
jgi:hypothetical protein